MFADRQEGGRRLAAALEQWRGPDTVVLGLPRGGVPVAAEVAAALHAPLDVIVVRKLGVPYQHELAMGAVGEEGVTVLNQEVLAHLHISQVELAAVAERERANVEERARRFRPGRDRLDLTGRTAILVDDGIATGSTARAGCAVARAHGAERVVLAVPVAPADCRAEQWAELDDFVCVERPHRFWAVGQFYEDFSEVSDDEVVQTLARAAKPAGEHSPPPDTQRDRQAVDQDVTITLGDAVLTGHLTVPADAQGIVLFAHGSGSSQHSPRNRYVASVLQAGGIGTLLFDLLTRAEETDRAAVFDIGLLADRLAATTEWLRRHPASAGLPLGYFGASTGAAAALAAAAGAGSGIAAVVSRGGRPDLAIPVLDQVRAPTLLIVGSHDDVVLDLNRRARQHLVCESELAVVPGASHLFEEPGTLDQAAALARDWFGRHLPASA